MDYYDHEGYEYEGEDMMDGWEGFEDGEAYFEGLGNEGNSFDEETGPLVRRVIKDAKKALRQPVTRQKVVQNAVKAAGAAVAGKKGIEVATKAAKKALKAVQNGEVDNEEEAMQDFEALGGDTEIYDQMQYLAQRAAESESESEADEWLGAVASLAGPLISSLLKESDNFEGEDGFDSFGDGEDDRDEFLPLLAAALPSVVKMATPLIKRGIGAIGSALNSPKTRGFIRQLPRMALNTANTVARQAQAGQPITPMRVAATLGQQACRTFMTPAPRHRNRQQPRYPQHYQQRRYQPYR